MTIGVWILGDQLSLNQSALMRSSNERNQTRAIMIESPSHVGKRPYHRQKVVLLWSAMRHFRDALRNRRWKCDYYSHAEDFESTLKNWVSDHSISELRVMEPNDRPFMMALSKIEIGCPIEVLPNNQFLWTTDEFREWASGRKRLVLEYFYREGRRKFDVLMDGPDPAGGVWNYDKQNREPPREDLEPPSPVWFEPDKMTQEVVERVELLNIPLFGESQPFRWGVTREHAQAVLEHFIKEGFSFFGPQEDAMRIGHPYMWHSLLSPYLNIGLIHPSEVLERVQKEYEKGGLELQSVEGFVRQILGWREYLRGVYHFVQEDYAESNYFQCDGTIPSFFWTGETKMRCLQ
ncbi:cryptochrome/photolyase family protein, partial [Candidatus Thorarchaeota archaeon]